MICSEECGPFVQPARIKHHLLSPSLLTFNAGERGNDDFLLHYGFVPPRNPHDDVSLFTGAACLQMVGLVGIVPRCSLPASVNVWAAGLAGYLAYHGGVHNQRPCRIAASCAVAAQLKFWVTC